MVQRKPVCKSGNILIEDDICNKSKEGYDGKKMLKKGRSFKHCSTESHSKKTSPSKSSTGSSPNYMKPTSSSDAKKECLQVSPKSRIYDLSLISKKLQASPKIRDVTGFKPTKNLSRSSSFRPVRPCLKKSCVVAMHPKHNISRPTCSSTIKDSKFPAYLELHHRGTEVEGTSVVKVCPYTYCSLNGHYHHEPLPSLKCFLAGKRKLLKAQRSRQLNETKMYGEPLKEVDQSIQSHTLVDEDVEFFIEVYVQPKEEYDAPSDFDQSSDRSCDMICEESACHNCEKDGEECVEQVLENSPELLQSDMEEMGTNNSMCSDQDDLDEKFSLYPEIAEAHPVILNEDEGEVIEHKMEEDARVGTSEDDNLMFDVLSIDDKEYQPIEEVFCIEEVFSVEEEEKSDEEVVKFSNHVLENNSSPDATLNLPPFEQDENEQEIKNEHNSMEQINTEAVITGQLEEIHATTEAIEVINIDYSDQNPLRSIEQASKSESEAAIHPEKQDKTEQPTIKEEEEESIKPILEPNNDGKERYNRKSRMAGEDDEEMDRDFNPRPPNFLPLEPDPDAEKVDLKHQMMDERKNAEEWMVDYALRSTVNKLGPARRRRVELLVEAFETVMPVHKWESRSPPPATSCCITHNMPLQACN